MIQLNNLHAQYESIKPEIDGAIENIISHSAFIGGDAVATFERNFAAYVGAEYCIAVGNGTDALEIILEAIGTMGHRVLVPALSAAPTVEAVVRSGAVPVFCDIDQSGVLNTEFLSFFGFGKDDVLLPVHLYGVPVDMDAVLRYAKLNGCIVVEDCAQAHGTHWRGKHVGTFGIAGAFSFYPSKNLGAWGDAGAIVTDDEAFAERCRALHNHGRLSKFDHSVTGRNSRMDGLQAAILNVKLRHLDQWNSRRRDNGRRYSATFPSPIWLNQAATYTYHQFPLLIRERETVRTKLREAGIATGYHYPFVLPDLEPYQQYARGDYPWAHYFAEHELSIPVNEMLSDGEVDYIIDTVSKVLRDV